MGYTDEELAQVIRKTTELVIQDSIRRLTTGLNELPQFKTHRSGFTIVGYFKHNAVTWCERVKVSDPSMILPALAKKVLSGKLKYQEESGRVGIYRQLSNWIVTAIFEGYVNPQYSPNAITPLSTLTK